MEIIVGYVIHTGSETKQKFYNIKSCVGERDKSHCTARSLGRNSADVAYVSTKRVKKPVRM